MRWSLFPKLFAGDSISELADRVERAGLETTKAVIREGYWVHPDRIAVELPRFIQSMADRGIHVDSASTVFSVDELTGTNSPIPAMAANGIRDFRMGWFPLPEARIADAVIEARRSLALVERLCIKHGIRAIYQLHHRTLVSSPSAAFVLTSGLDPNHIGVELDPGNQVFEGFEAWAYACDLLREYIRWVAIKDARHVGDRVEFVPVGQGETSWDELMSQLSAIGFSGDLVFMPFYDAFPSSTWDQMLANDVNYLKPIVARHFSPPHFSSRQG